MTRENELPPKIQELLKRKGWMWPPDEALRTEMREALERFSGSVDIPEDILEELYQDLPGHEYARRWWLRK